MRHMWAILNCSSFIFQMRKLASKRKENETNFEEKRMNMSIDDDKDYNKENDRGRYVKDPYYDNV